MLRLLHRFQHHFDRRRLSIYKHSLSCGSGKEDLLPRINLCVKLIAPLRIDRRRIVLECEGDWSWPDRVDAYCTKRLLRISSVLAIHQLNRKHSIRWERGLGWIGDCATERGKGRGR